MEITEALSNELFFLLKAAIIFILIEYIVNKTVFPWLNSKYNMEKQDGEKIPNWQKGSIERTCLVTGICLGYPQILIAYGALKIGTKLGGEKESNIRKQTLNPTTPLEENIQNQTGTDLIEKPNTKDTFEKTYTEYYLIGNLISILIAFFTVYLVQFTPNLELHNPNFEIVLGK